VTTLLVTHDQEEALELANQIVVMHEGRVEQVGSPGEIYDEPATPFVAGFVGAANVLHGEVIDGHVHLGSIRIPGAAHLDEGAAAAAFVRPHDVVVTDDDGGTVAVIERVSSLGWLSRVSLRLPGGETLVAHIPNDDLHGAAEGSAVRVDLRNPKAFMASERGDATLAS
jgi:sulfate/thiosulfate transport system ATP-binding protein